MAVSTDAAGGPVRIALPTAAGLISRLAYARAHAAGIDLTPLLEKAGLTIRQIEDRNVRIHVRDQIKFLALVAEALDDELLGFHLASDFDLRTIGLIYYVLASSPVLGDALRRAERYGKISNDGIALTYLDRKEIVIDIRYLDVSRHSDRQQIEFWIIAVIRVCRELTDRPLHPLRAKLMHRRAERSSELEAFMGCEVAFGADADQLVFPKSVGNASLVGADPYLNELLTAYCEEALAPLAGRGGAIRPSVENTIAPLLPHGKAVLGEVADRLRMSKRTLSRRLAAEGLTFAGVRHDMRLVLAKRYLEDETSSISEIAWLLGYQEVGAFTHAFKRWTGKTPREIRAEMKSKSRG